MHAKCSLLAAAAMLAAASLASAARPVIPGSFGAISASEGPVGGPEAVVAYDYTTSGAGGFTQAQPRPTLIGDVGTLGVAIGPGQRFEVTSVTVARAHGGVAGGVDVGFLLYDNVNVGAGAGTQLMSGLVGGGVFNRTVAAGNTQILTTVLTFTPGTTFLSDADFGFEMVYAAPGSIGLTGDVLSYTPNTIGVGGFFADRAASGIGSSPDVFLADVNGDKLLDETEGLTFTTPNEAFSNVYLQISGNVVAVPEPTTLGLAGVAVLGLVRRRRA